MLKNFVRDFSSKIIMSDENKAQRMNFIETFAKENGLVYTEKIDELPGLSCDFALANVGRNPSFSSVLTGKNDEDQITLVTDYNFSNKSEFASGHATLMIIQRPYLELPDFFVRDEYLISDTLGKLFGGQDINFSIDPVFSPKFILQGSNEEKIRALFNQYVRTAFVNNHIKNCRYEGNGEIFMLLSPMIDNQDELWEVYNNCLSLFSELTVNR